MNLLLNSLQAMNGHGQLTIRAIPRGSELEVTIQDTGVGIPPKALTHIFEPFYTTKPAGTGLGLAIVQSILQQRRGALFQHCDPAHNGLLEALPQLGHRLYGLLPCRTVGRPFGVRGRSSGRGTVQ